MKTNDAPTRYWKNPRKQWRLRSHGKSQAPISALAATLLSIVCMTIFCANTVSSQGLRKAARIQRKIDRKAPDPASDPNKLTPSTSGKEEPGASEQPGGTATQAETQQIGHNLEGIRERGIPSLFAKDEASLWIQGFGNRAALLVIFRQLDLTPQQKVKIRDLRRQVGNRLALTRRDFNQLEAQLVEAIYGNLDPASLDSYDPAKVKELTEQVIQKQAELFRLQTDIESQFRQILTPDQFYVYRELVLQIIQPAGRPLINPAVRRQQQQRRMGTAPNPQSKPNPQDQEE